MAATRVCWKPVNAGLETIEPETGGIAALVRVVLPLAVSAFTVGRTLGGTEVT